MPAHFGQPLRILRQEKLSGAVLSVAVTIPLLISLLLVSQLDYDEILTILEISFLAFLCAIPFFKERVREVTNPVLSVSMLYFIMFCLGSLYVLLYPESFNRLGYNAGLDLTALNKGLSFSILCFLFFLFGYYAFDYSKLAAALTGRAIKSIPNIHKFELSIRRLPLVIVVLLLIGWLSRLFLIEIGAYYFVGAGRSDLINTDYAYLAQFLGFGSLFPLLALSIVYSEYLKNKRIALLWVTILILASEMAFNFPIGSKAKAILPIFILLIIYSIKKKTPFKLFIIASIIFIFFIFPLINTYRLNYTGDVFFDLMEGFKIYWKSFFGSNKSMVGEVLFSVFGERLNYASIVGVIVDNTPSVSDFKFGSTYILFFPSLIPRVLWPGKPSVSFANEFGRDYGFLHPLDESTSVGMTWIGEMFINFGWFGIFVPLIYGFLYRFIFLYFFRNGKPNTLGTVVYAFTLQTIIVGDTFAGWFSGLLRFYFILLVAFLPFVTRHK
ncbi:MAG TPA: O-antigen polysaccharide polymerase Wzy [Thermodesulfobacteriota bacterium]|nr:O-antigen polysaccharide polymerase Wzy [Thermodesulfobacteriota bacterium]